MEGRTSGVVLLVLGRLSGREMCVYDPKRTLR
jgi:hypothetical protein